MLLFSALRLLEGEGIRGEEGKGDNGIEGKERDLKPKC